MIDYSSANSFLSDLLDKYRGSVFRFRFDANQESSHDDT